MYYSLNINAEATYLYIDLCQSQFIEPHQLYTNTIDVQRVDLILNNNPLICNESDEYYGPLLADQYFIEITKNEHSKNATYNLDMCSNHTAPSIFDFIDVINCHETIHGIFLYFEDDLIHYYFLNTSEELTTVTISLKTCDDKKGLNVALYDESSKGARRNSHFWLIE